MRTIAIAASKGGVGKTTLTAALAVEAMNDGRGQRVAMIDWEPQGSLTFWWTRRGRPVNPQLIAGAPDPVETVKSIRDWHDYLFIDTPPSGIDPIERAIEAADFVLIPTHASLFDLAAIRPVAELCCDLAKPYGYLINERDPNRRGLNESAVKTLDSFGGPALKATVQDRSAFVSAANLGKAGQEHPDKRQRDPAAAEIAAVWAEIKAIMKKAGI